MAITKIHARSVYDSRGMLLATLNVQLCEGLGSLMTIESRLEYVR